MGRGQQFGHRARFGPHHVADRRRDEFVGGVGLAAFEQLNAQWAFEAGQVADQPRLQSGYIELVAVADGTGANEVVFQAHVSGPSR